MIVITKHNGKTQGDINDNEQFLDHLNFLKEDSVCNVRIDEYYNIMLNIFVSSLGLKEIYVYYTEENSVGKEEYLIDGHVYGEYAVDGYIYKVSGLEELRKILYEKSYTLDEDEIDSKIEALEVLFG